MKYSIQFILLLFSFFSFSQTDPVTRISKSSTLSFVADNTGCFGGEIVEYKFTKKKNGDRIVTILRKDVKPETKKLSAKSYSSFIGNFKVSYDKFKDPESVKQTCTSVSSFVLKDPKINVSFANVTCEADLNPEMFLQKLLNTNGTQKK